MSKFLILALSLLSIACARPSAQSSSELEANSTTNIYGGKKPSSQSELAHSVVAIVSDSSGLCSGVLISDNVVLTAAHCLAQHPDEMKVVFNQVVSKNSLFRPVSRIVAHPQFSSAKSENWNDIALVFLTESAPSGYSPKPIFKSKPELDEGESLKTFGFGIEKVRAGLKDSERGAGVLREINLDVVNPEFSNTEFTLNQGPWDGGACHGDSGGPVFVVKNGVAAIVGLVSRARGIFGVSCIVDSIVTRVDIYASWIQQEMHKSLEIEAE